MFDFTPAIIGFFVVAGVALALAAVAVATLVSDARRRPTRPVVAISAAHPAVAAATRRAA